MKQKGRYSTQGSNEGEFEPRSRNRVLKNINGITKKKDIYFAETSAYFKIITELLNSFEVSKKLTSQDICKIHKSWLGEIYSWAGEYRNVNISKSEFQFASAHRIPVLMKEFENKILRRYTPCQSSNLEDIAAAIAIVHAEFILIHPFREGNGRLGRLIAVLMGLQADLPILNFEIIKGKKKQEYFHAVQAGINGNYNPMKKIFLSVIKKSIKLYHVD